MRSAVFLSLLLLLGTAACRDSRIHEESDWADVYQKAGVQRASILVRDHTHEAVYYLDKDECLRRTIPASTAKVFLSLVALETGIAPDDGLVIPFTGAPTTHPEWNKDLTLREAFKVSSEPYFQELARREGVATLRRYLDTVQYGNKQLQTVDRFWHDGSLQLSPDEQVGFMKRLYFYELPFAERSQRIVKSLMLREDSADYKLYYKTGWGDQPDGSAVLWVVGFSERLEKVKELKGSMNNSDLRAYPYFFAQRFELPKNYDTARDWAGERIVLLKQVLRKMDAL